MTKQVYELTAADLERYPVWVFPMDDSVEDEASVRPVKRGEIVPDGLQRIGRAVFTDGRGRSWPGYMYLGGGVDVEDARPVVWCRSSRVQKQNELMNNKTTPFGVSFPTSMTACNLASVSFICARVSLSYGV